MADETIQSMFLSSERRLNRLKYFKRTLVIGVVAILLNVLFSNEDGSDNAFTLLLSIFFLVPSYFLDVQRLKDLDKDSTIAILDVILGLVFMVFAQDSLSIEMMNYGIITGEAKVYIFVSLIQTAIWVYLCFAEGTHGRNKYGEDPLEANES